jgi:hypothetical protein
VATVESTVTAMTDSLVGARDRYRVPRLKSFWAADWWAPGQLNSFPNFKLSSNSKFKMEASRAPKIFKLFMGLNVNILNNFLHWVDFKPNKIEVINSRTDPNLNLL